MGPAVVLSGFSAILLNLAFPRPAVRALVFLALVPFFVALRNQGWKRGALLGLVQGVLYHGQLLVWANFFGPPAYGFLVLYKALGPVLLGASLASRRPRSATLAVFWTAAAYVALEFYQTLGPFGITWGMLSHALARWPAWIQIDALGGPWALSLVLALVNAALAESLLRRRAVWPALGTALLAVLGTYGFGQFMLSQPEPAETCPLGLIQPSMGRELKWNPNLAEESMTRLFVLTGQAAAQGAQVIVWPETTIPYRDFLRSPSMTFRIGMLARRASAWLLVGSIEMSGDGDPNDPRDRYKYGHTYNTMSLVSPQGGFTARYDKQRLVPGGEYLPLDRWLGGYAIFDRIMNYLPGTRSGVFECRLPLGQVKLGEIICYESMVPQPAVQRVKEGATVLAISTNDAWFGESAAIFHHFEMAIMRAVECHRPVVQAGNTGVSGLIDRLGRVQRESVINVPTVLVGPVAPSQELTLYARIGDVLAYLCLLGWAWGAFAPQRTMPD